MVSKVVRSRPTSYSHRLSLHVEGIDACQPHQVRWQLGGSRHASVFQKDGDHGDPALQRGRHLDPNEVLRVVKPPAPERILHREPLVSDEGEQDIARRDRLLDHVHEVDAGLDGVHVHKHPGLTEVAP